VKKERIGEGRLRRAGTFNDQKSSGSARDPRRGLQQEEESHHQGVHTRQTMSQKKEFFKKKGGFNDTGRKVKKES